MITNYFYEKRTTEQFLKNVEVGEQYESIAIKLLCNKYKLTLLRRNQDKYYDFELSNNLKYECKHHKNYFKYPYIFIEYARINKNGGMYQTGLSITDADYYILTDGATYYLIKTDLLKNLCFKYNIIRKQYFNSINYCFSSSVLDLHFEKLSFKS